MCGLLFDLYFILGVLGYDLYFVSGGLGFDFYPSNNNIYLVATEEGFIHKCSCSYNEQYLQTYTGHTGRS